MEYRGITNKKDALAAVKQNYYALPYVLDHEMFNKLKEVAERYCNATQR